ncbi:DsbA family oxidoreductase [Paenibacillus xylaniclasticus]|uniref:DsbA family oxidoreductase n=1 Tax=Paenibacillus xylaniclasticus TaxID=588083 RepID=UPI000FDA5F93|nr:MULTISPECIES: DsbA family oxidoreductase [Paenibacillus]GFN32751.1 DSBA oxidoreductase [Paenibacillus curdlanolyticus]
MHIELFSDFVCPWCRIGIHNLFAALEDWSADNGGRKPSITYRAFMLNPDTPEEGVPFKQWAAYLTGGPEQMKRVTDQVTDAAAAVGLTMRFDRIRSYPNTRLAHRLLALTPNEHRTALTNALFQAYFEDGQDIGQLDVLESIAASLPLNEQTLAEQLAQGEGEHAVAWDLQRADRIGVTGIPYFVFESKFALCGAYPKAEFAALLGRMSFGTII